MNQIPESFKKPIDLIRTPNEDELKIYAVKNRNWFDITDSLVTPELLDQLAEIESALNGAESEIIDIDDRLENIEGDYVTRTTNQTITGVKTFTKPQILSVLMQVADGSAGSANSWVLGYSYSEVSGGIVNGYPENTGITEVIKITNNRTIQNFISSSSGILYTRSLHSASNKDWIKYVPEAPFDGNIKGRKDGEWVNVPSSSGGDVTQAGDNDFTGENSFVTSPTSAGTATSVDSLVSLKELSGTYTTISGSLSLTDEGGSATYSGTFSGLVNRKRNGQEYIRIYISDINTTGSPSGTLTINFDPVSISVGARMSTISEFKGSSVTDIEKYIPSIFGSDKIIFTRIDSDSDLSSVVFTSGVISLALETRF